MSQLTSKTMKDFFKSACDGKYEYIEPVYFVTKSQYESLLRNDLIIEADKRVRIT